MIAEAPEKIMGPSLGFQPSQEAKHLAHKVDEMDSTRPILVLLLLGLNSELSQIRSLPYCLRMAVMLQCRLIRWVRNVRCQFLKNALDQALMRTVRYARNASFWATGDYMSVVRRSAMDRGFYRCFWNSFCSANSGHTLRKSVMSHD